MTRKLEESLGLTPISKTKYQVMEDMISEANKIDDVMSIADSIDAAIMDIQSLHKHDAEMDEIAGLAIGSYKDLVDLGLNVSDGHTARLFEVANGMLRTAMDARDSKINRKLKTIELQLKKVRLDKEKSEAEPMTQEEQEKSTEHDRNEILAHIRAGIKEAQFAQTEPTPEDK